MDDKWKLKMLQNFIEARNTVRLAQLKKDNADMRARLLTSKLRSITGQFPQVFHDHLAARYGTSLDSLMTAVDTPSHCDASRGKNN